jgi:glycosyltransferase involved in cell wall biosynthesis
VASNPRLVKEADALHAAGYRVRVVSGTSHPLVEPLDRALLASRPWSAVRVPLGSKWSRFPRALRQRVSARVARNGWTAATGVVAWSESELVGRLVRAASAEPADLYIGHYLPGLYAAWRAARRHGAALGFDAEDSHVDELPDDPAHAGRRRARERLERRLIPACRHLTASSPLIADAYERRYGRRPVTVLNVFPLSQAPAEPVTTPYLAGDGPPTLYWFSQTIGPGRGLEEVVTAMGRMTVPAVLHLRGIPAAGYQSRLTELAAAHGASGRLVWHPPADPDDMARLAARFDVGLATETGFTPNNGMALSNKVFTYVLAGVPVVLSRTVAQELIARELGSAGWVTTLSDPSELAAGLDRLLAVRAGLADRRAAAWRAGRQRLNWDRESESFRASVRRALEPGGQMMAERCGG